MNRITPPESCRCIVWFARWAKWSGAIRLRRRIDSWKRGDAVAASAGGAPPALFTSTSIRPNRSSANAATVSICSTSRTSAAVNSARRPPPAGRLSGCLRPQITTSAPASSRLSLIPRPTPRPPPVTIATRPERSIDSATSEPDRARDALAVPRGGAEQRLRGARALEVEMGIVFPREADAAEDLDRLGRAVVVGLAAIGLRERGRDREIRSVLRRGARRVVGRRTRGLDAHHHVGALVFDRLERADRASELLPLLRVRDREIEAALRAADRLGRERDRAEVERAAQRRGARSLVAEPRRGG